MIILWIYIALYVIGLIYICTVADRKMIEFIHNETNHYFTDDFIMFIVVFSNFFLIGFYSLLKDIIAELRIQLIYLWARYLIWKFRNKKK